MKSVNILETFSSAAPAVSLSPGFGMVRVLFVFSANVVLFHP